MAEIDVQRKEGKPIWPWIVGILALLLVIGLIWALAGDRDTRDRGAMPADTVPATRDTVPPAATWDTAPADDAWNDTMPADAAWDTVPPTDEP